MQECRFLDFVDGTLAALEGPVLRGAVIGLLEELQPGVVITFGADGAFGHPDHIAISGPVTEACAAVGDVRLSTATFLAAG